MTESTYNGVHPHPAVRRPEKLTRGERSADRMKRMLATWPALIFMVIFIAVWMTINSHLAGGSHHFDPYPWILLNLCLSTLAGLQCFVLLIANKRGEQIAAEIAVDTLNNTKSSETLLQQNTDLTSQVHDLVVPYMKEIHQHVETILQTLVPGTTATDETQRTS